MRFNHWLFAWVAVSFSLLAPNGESGTIGRDFSGDAMQRNDSRMMASPLERIPPLLGLSRWPFIPYLPAPSLTVVTVEINHFSTLVPSSTTPAPPPAARPKFWTNRCGVFEEINVSPETNLLEEEQTSC
jgi:hypothetical protein